MLFYPTPLMSKNGEGSGVGSLGADWATAAQGSRFEEFLEHSTLAGKRWVQCDDHCHGGLFKLYRAYPFQQVAKI